MIKTIILDLGGVLLEVDYLKTEKSFTQLGLKEINTLYNQSFSNELFEQLEIGKISPEDFYKKIQSLLPNQEDFSIIEKAWNAMLGDFLWTEIDYLQKLEKAYPLFLYSNTNAIHYKKIIENYAKYDRPFFENYFKKTYYSHLFGWRKPHPESYLALCKIEKLKPAETLFIDDTLINIEGAKDAGLQTIHLKKGMQLSELNLL